MKWRFENRIKKQMDSLKKVWTCIHSTVCALEENVLGSHVSWVLTCCYTYECGWLGKVACLYTVIFLLRYLFTNLAVFIIKIVICLLFRVC